VTSPIRVLVVDDSAFARKVLREVLSAAPDIEVVGTARDGLEALEKAAELRPDVITLDLVMPNLDGLGVLDGLDPAWNVRVLIVSTADGESELAIAALQRGAVDLVRKSTSLATDRLYESGDELVRKVREVAGSRPPALRPLSKQPLARRSVGSRSLLVVGTSTGGPQAISRLLCALPEDFPLPIAVALHIPAGYTQALAKRIDDNAAIEVVEAEEGVLFAPGRAVIARGGQHLQLQRRFGELYGTIGRVPADTAHFPSVNVLFASAAEQCGAGTMALVLTGMGDDGAIGASLIRKAGGYVITEAASSCVVYGMPRSVKEAGDSDAEAPLDALPALILSKL
jgi:two-component system, chemotaxis family, protein-glutamate methylesterase/glutaminase